MADSDVPTYLDWLDDDDALAVVSGQPASSNDGWLTIAGNSHFTVGSATDEDSGHLVIGLKPGQTGTVALTGAGTSLTVAGDLDVGEYGTGQLTAAAGATVFSDDAYVGYRPGSAGTVSLDGVGTSWQVKDNFYVGYQGNGLLQLSGGAAVLGNSTDESCFYVGYDAGSAGAVRLTGSGTQIQLYDGSFIIGSAGLGAMSIQNGAAAYGGSAYLGDESTGQGAVQVTGAGSLWQLSQTLSIGGEGQGAATVQDGGRVACTYLTVAAYHGSLGALAISGPQSVCSVAKDAFLGGWMDDVLDRNTWADGGRAGVSIADGGTLSVGRNLWVGGQAAVQLSGGTLDAQNLYIMPGGTVVCTNGQLNIQSQISVDGVLQTDQPLSIGNGMSLVGNGQIISPETHLLAGSLLSPGHSIGTLSFTGNLRLDPGSRLEIALGENGLCDKIAVSDTLHLGGTLALSGLGAGGPSWGYVFASSGRCDGAFDAIDASALPLAPKRVVSSDHWSLIKFKDLSELANTGNARQVAAALDAMIDAGVSNALTDRLVTIGNDQAMSAGLDQMHGELYATLSTLGVQNTTNVYRVLSDRLRPEPALAAPGVALAGEPTALNTPYADNVFYCGGRDDAGSALPRLALGRLGGRLRIGRTSPKRRQRPRRRLFGRRHAGGD